MKMIVKRINERGLVWFEGEKLGREGIVHGFSSRVGGVSGGVFAGLNLGNPGKALYGGELDDVANVKTNLGLFLMRWEQVGWDLLSLGRCIIIWLGWLKRVILKW